MKEFTATDPSGDEILSWNYAHDAVGNITERSRDSETTEYSYDGLDRLTGIDGPTETNEFGYDGVGNRLSEWAFQDGDGTPYNWEYDERDRLVKRGPIEYEYDANGSRILKRDTSSGSKTRYHYDAHNRLVQVDKDGSIIAKYAYDPFGQRISKEVGDEKTYFLYSPEGLVAESKEYGEIYTSYGWEPGSLWGTNPLFIKQEGQYGYYLNDHLGAPWMVVSSSGRVLWAGSYGAFGTLVVDHLVISQNLRFPGQYFDPETGYHYNLHRYYDPREGRYVSGDPITMRGGLNSYEYSRSNPGRWIDPFGLRGMDRVYGAIYRMTGEWTPSQNSVDRATGIADSMSLGIGPWLRNRLEIGGVDICSDAYIQGQRIGMVAGGGRAAYAGLARAGANLARTARQASNFRNRLKLMGSFGISRLIRWKTYSDLRRRGRTDSEIRRSSGKTNPAANAIGFNAAIGGGINEATRECEC